MSATEIPNLVTPSDDINILTKSEPFLSTTDAEYFCPHINYNKKDFMKRSCPSSVLKMNSDDDQSCCATYRWSQTEDFISVQHCQLKKTPETNIELCERKFKNCALYRKVNGLTLTNEHNKELDRLTNEGVAKKVVTKSTVRRKA